MADETSEHIRNRIETLRERARDRAGEVGGRVQGAGRADSIRAATRMTGAPGERRTVSIAGRRESSVATVSRGAELRGSGIEVDTETRAAQVLASRQGAAAAGAKPDAATRAASVEAGRGAPPSSGLGATTVRTTSSTVTAAGTAAPAPASSGAGPGQAPEERRGFKPWMAAAAAGAVVVAGILWFVLRPSSKPADPAVTGVPGQQAGQPGTPGAAGTAGQQGQAGTGQPGVAGTPQAAKPGAPGQAATGQPGAKPSAAIRTVHEVRPGNSLWRISKFYYKRGAKWRRIHEENQEQIRDPNLIYPKQKFRIPE